MAAAITHYLFGVHSLAQFNGDFHWNQDEQDAFIIGQQGPDPFFYCVRSKTGKASRALGSLLHERNVNQTFDEIRKLIDELPTQDQNVAKAYVLGFLGHYTLDSTVHPFVFAQQYGIIKSDPMLAPFSSEIHSIIESDLDSMMLWRLEGKTVESFNPQTVLTASDYVLDVVGRIFQPLAKKVYGLIISKDDYSRAIGDFRLAIKVVDHPSQGPLVMKAERFVRRGKSILNALSHRTDIRNHTTANNPERLPWENPFVEGEFSRASFWDLFHSALAQYELNAQAFIQREEPATFTRNRNYSGIPLLNDIPLQTS